MRETFGPPQEAIETRDSIPVSNEVIYVNDNINLPFDFEIGKEADLARFLTDLKGTEGKLQLGIDSIHGRSAFLGKIKIGDKQGNVYTDVDFKGGGYVEWEAGSAKVKKIERFTHVMADETKGLWNKDDAELERDITERLSMAGVRTCRIAAIMKLNEISMPDGTKISVEDAKKQGLVEKDKNPVLGLRLYRYRERIEHEQKRSQKIFERVKKIVEAEIKHNINWDGYIEWFASTLGKNIACMHKAGIRSGAISLHNVTLACELLDVDVEGGKQYLEEFDIDQQRTRKGYDLQQGIEVLAALLERIKNSVSEDILPDGLVSNNHVEKYDYERKIFDIYEKTYNENIKKIV